MVCSDTCGWFNRYVKDLKRIYSHASSYQLRIKEKVLGNNFVRQLFVDGTLRRGLMDTSLFPLQQLKKKKRSFKFILTASFKVLFDNQTVQQPAIKTRAHDWSSNTSFDGQRNNTCGTLGIRWWWSRHISKWQRRRSVWHYRRWKWE